MNGIALDMSPDEFKKMLWEVLNENRSIPDQEHTEHHKILKDILPSLKEFLDERKHRKQMWDKFRLSFIGGLALAFITVLTWLGSIVVEHILRIVRH